MMRWLKFIWQALLLIFGTLREQQVEEQAHNQQVAQEVEQHVQEQIEQAHQEVVDSPDPHATVESQLDELYSRTHGK